MQYDKKKELKQSTCNNKLMNVVVDVVGSLRNLHTVINLAPLYLLYTPLTHITFCNNNTKNYVNYIFFNIYIQSVWCEVEGKKSVAVFLFNTIFFYTTLWRPSTIFSMVTFGACFFFFCSFEQTLEYLYKKRDMSVHIKQQLHHHHC